MGRVSPGKIAYQLFFRPLGELRWSLAWGGPVAHRKALRGHEEMKVAAWDLPPLREPSAPSGLSVNFLSGDRYLHQTLFCFYSLQLVVDGRVDVTVYDDGTFTPVLIDALRAKIGWVEIVTDAEAQRKVDAWLPRDRFPVLRARRDEYPMFRKIMDVHCDSQEYRIIFDSDMLLFRTPQALLDWANTTERPAIYMSDFNTEYGYDIAFLEGQIGRKLPELINGGLYGIHGGKIDWDEMEACLKEQMERFGPSYFHEQTMLSQQLSRDATLRLPASEYVLKPTTAEGYRPTAVLHHYVMESRRAYFDHGWRVILDRAGRTAARIAA